MEAHFPIGEVNGFDSQVRTGLLEGSFCHALATLMQAILRLSKYTCSGMHFRQLRTERLVINLISTLSFEAKVR